MHFVLEPTPTRHAKMGPLSILLHLHPAAGPPEGGTASVVAVGERKI
jgi:hypothetical protein